MLRLCSPTSILLLFVIFLTTSTSTCDAYSLSYTLGPSIPLPTFWNGTNYGSPMPTPLSPELRVSLPLTQVLNSSEPVYTQGGGYNYGTTRYYNTLVFPIEQARIEQGWSYSVDLSFPLGSECDINSYAQYYAFMFVCQPVGVITDCIETMMINGTNSGYRSVEKWEWTQPGSSRLGINNDNRCGCNSPDAHETALILWTTTNVGDNCTLDVTPYIPSMYCSLPGGKFVLNSDYPTQGRCQCEEGYAGTNCEKQIHTAKTVFSDPKPSSYYNPTQGNTTSQYTFTQIKPGLRWSSLLELNGLTSLDLSISLDPQCRLNTNVSYPFLTIELARCYSLPSNISQYYPFYYSPNVTFNFMSSLSTTPGPQGSPPLGVLTSDPINSNGYSDLQRLLWNKYGGATSSYDSPFWHCDYSSYQIPGGDLKQNVRITNQATQPFTTYRSATPSFITYPPSQYFQGNNNTMIQQGRMRFRDSKSICGSYSPKDDSNGYGNGNGNTYTDQNGEQIYNPDSYRATRYDDLNCLKASRYWLIRVKIEDTAPSDLGDQCRLAMQQTNKLDCSDSILSCGVHSSAYNQNDLDDSCQPATLPPPPPSSSPLTSNITSSTIPLVSNELTCGSCQDGYEGLGCLVPRPAYTELVNRDSEPMQSQLGARVSVRIQVSPSNNPVAVTFDFARLYQNYYNGGNNQTNSSSSSSSSSSCPNGLCTVTLSHLYIRARLGSPPPSLIVSYQIDQQARTAVLSSDGMDEEGSSGYSVASNNNNTSTSRRLFGLISTDTQPVAPPSRQVYRNDEILIDQYGSTTITFPSDKFNFTITENAFLYIDLYQAKTIDVSQQGENNGGGGRINTATQNMYSSDVTVSVKIDDSLGTKVGQAALVIVMLFAAAILVYLIYLRCRYGGFLLGLEKSLLTKTKVKRLGGRNSSASTGGILDSSANPDEMLTDEQLARRERLQRQSTRYRQAGENSIANERSIAKDPWWKTLLKILVVFFAFAAILLFELLKVLFNISILHTSVGSFLPVVAFDRVKESVAAGLRSLGLEDIKEVWYGFTRFFEFLGIFNEVSLKWNCGGALSMFAPIVILLGSFVLIFILQKDYLLRFALSLRGSEEGTSKVVRKLKKAIAMMLSTILLYILQSSILILTQVVASTWDVKRSCSEFDVKLVYIGRWVCIVWIVILFYVAGLMFAGIKTIDKASLTKGWFTGVWALIQLTFGLWTPATVARFDIHARALDFDIDDNHDDNPEEAVMEIQAASRGLMWTAFPIGIVLTKLTEQINQPPIWIFGSNQATGANKLGVDITTPLWNRGLKWIVGMSKLLAVFYTVWSANRNAVLAAFILTALSVFLTLILPSDYHKQKWLKGHVKTRDQEAEDGKNAASKAQLELQAIAARGAARPTHNTSLAAVQPMSPSGMGYQPQFEGGGDGEGQQQPSHSPSASVSATHQQNKKSVQFQQQQHQKQQPSVHFFHPQQQQTQHQHQLSISPDAAPLFTAPEPQQYQQHEHQLISPPSMMEAAAPVPIAPPMSPSQVDHHHVDISPQSQPMSPSQSSHHHHHHHHVDIPPQAPPMDIPQAPPMAPAQMHAVDIPDAPPMAPPMSPSTSYHQQKHHQLATHPSVQIPSQTQMHHGGEEEY